MPPDTKTKLISIQTPNQVIFDPHTNPSQFWSLYWNQVNPEPSHLNHVYVDHPSNHQVNVDASTKTYHFRAVAWPGLTTTCLLYTSDAADE